MTPKYFAYKQKLDWLVYKDLAKREKNIEFKQTLERLIDHEHQDYMFWRQYLEKDIKISPWKIWFFRFLRKTLGITFTVRFLEGREEDMIGKYSQYLQTLDNEEEKRGLEEILRHERYHEEQFLKLIREEKVDFVASIVLGMNDGLIELTGALAGFSLALQNSAVVAMAGLITGVSAALSMTASAFMAAKHEIGGHSKNPKKAAAYTGISYFIVVIVLITPYFLIGNTLLALAVMIGLVLIIIALMTLYTSVLFQYKFTRQFSEMAFFSLGVAIIAFFIGYLFQRFSGINL